MRHAFEALKFHRVEYKTDVRNARSRAAILKLGATQEGIFRKHMIMADGHVRDLVYFSIVDTDWPAVKAGLEKRLRGMSRYLASRLVGTVVTLALMSFVVYLLIGLMPGDPIDMMIAGDPKMTSEDAARLRAVYGIDKPLLERYLAWAGQALQGNFGYSRSFNQPVLAVLGPRLLNTLHPGGIAFVLATAIALPLGIWAANRPRSRADYLVNLFCFAGISVPPFWLALLLITLFAV